MTGTIILFPGGVGPDGTGSGNDSAALTMDVSAGTQTTNTPKATALKLAFGDAVDQHWMFNFLLPGDYASGGTLRGKLKMETATTGNVIMKAGQVTTIDGSTDDDAVVFAAGDLSAAIAAPGTQGQTVEFTIALTATNMAANRKIALFIGRDQDNGSDTMTGKAELVGLNFEYVTT